MELTPEEQAFFVDYARTIDDGEARTAAVAVHRRLRVATDDRKAIRLINGLQPAVPVVTTLQWLQHWNQQLSPTPEVLRTALRGVRWKAQYLPKRRPENTADYDWWQQNYPEE